MNTETVAIFMLGIIVGQRLGVLVALKVIRAMVGPDSSTAADVLEKPDARSPLFRLLYRQLSGGGKPRGNQAKKVPPAKKTRRRPAR